ncbi:MAG: hypothetical protein K2Q18_04740, partial [Bdellovibrionales bacterium]|nr:hypothetical protein [Bdellovibrionales bacterium]
MKINNQLPSLESINQILDCYSSLGKKKNKIGKSFEGYNCHLWYNEVMSPIFITNPKIWTKDLKKIEAHFNKPIPKSKYSRKFPYFDLLTVGKKRVDPKLIRSLKAQGWNTAHKDNSLNLWRSPIPLELPKGVQVKFGNYFDKEMYPHFLKTMKINFKCDTFFMNSLNKMIKTIDQEVFTVLVYKNGKVAGAGLVSVKNSGAFLFCGSIYKAYRNKNLWKVLASARQAVSA